MSGKIINLCIVAHVDAGKTTLTERLLHLCGAIREPGRVDDGTAHTDFLDVERRRGISVRAASTTLAYKDATINLIDTPGHMDFAAEVERSLAASDAVLFLLSAVEGIQAQSRAIWRALKDAGKPVAFFLNKIDRIGADAERVLADVRGEWTDRVVRADGIDWDAPRLPEPLIEAVAQSEEALLDRYIDGDLSHAEATGRLPDLFARGIVCPALTGAALAGQGVPELLEMLYRLCPGAETDVDAEPSGIVYRIEHDKTLGRIAHVRLFSGTVHNRDVLHNATQDRDEKVTQIRKHQLQRAFDAGVLRAGDTGVLCGLSRVRIGDVLGDPSRAPEPLHIAEPLLKVRVTPGDEEDYPRLVEALGELTAEDPHLAMEWVREERELIVHITGLIQLEILEATVRDRFALDVVFSPPSVIYKETPAQEGFGFEAYTMPKPCWAVLKFHIRPMPRGSGVTFQSVVGEMQIMHRYQSQVWQALPGALRQGPQGWNVTDLHVTLVDGNHHLIHTHPLDFIVATPMAILDGLTRTGTHLLEPMLAFEMRADEALLGRLIGEILAMRGAFDSPVIHNGMCIIRGRYPAATSMHFPARLASLSGGKAELGATFDGYEICPPEFGQKAAYRGVYPLDRAKYILWARGALS